jgi:hypothetical protein
LSIADLERMLNQQRRGVQKLEKKRAILQRKIDLLDREITSLGGNGSGLREVRGRGRNSVSLVSALETALKGKAPQGVGEIVDAVRAGGYHSKSDNFRGIVNQTLIREKKRFAKAGRGMYELKA